MSRVFSPLRSAAALAIAAALAACGQSQQHAGFAGFPPAEVTTQVIAVRNFPVAFEYVGQTLGSKDVEVRARVTGIIEKRLYQEGAPVKAGQPLFTIDPKPYAAQVAQAQAELVRAEAQKAQADRERARLAPLAERKAIGQKEADDATSNAELAAASVQSARAKLDELKL
ncbi:MAG: biotin/lipoyl-binding protein, partial [Betaproteobacteria bacterium]